jgi:hypothetical protein
MINHPQQRMEGCRPSGLAEMIPVKPDAGNAAVGKRAIRIYQCIILIEWCPTIL